MNRFLGLVERDIAGHALLAERQTILVAVSGGLDSVVLLEALDRLSRKHRWRLIVAHFNHQLRGRQSDGDERFVQALASRLGWPFVMGREAVARRAQSRGVSIEMAAREARHAFLAGAARKERADTLALAHHADDQAELFLLRLLRGAGSEGLGGMRWSVPSPVNPQVRLIRPLLGRTRAEIESFAQAWSLSFRHDSSNDSLDILRNRVRTELIPLLQRHYQAGVAPLLNRQAELLAADAEFLGVEARKWLARSARGRPAFARLAIALQRRILVEQLTTLGINPEFTKVEALRTKAAASVRVSVGRAVRRLPDGTVSEAVPVKLGPKDLAGSAGRRGIPAEVAIDLPDGAGRGQVAVGPYQVQWRIRMGRRPEFTKPRSGREWVDADKLGGRIHLRTRRPGDRFQPLGLAAPASLQNLLVNARIPRERRPLLLLASNALGQIWWVDGLRLGEACKVDEGTRRFLEWKWEIK